MNKQDELRASFRSVAAQHLRAALAAIEHADDTEAGRQLCSAAIALAEAGVLPQLATDPVAMIYERRATANRITQTLTVTRCAPRRRARKPHAARDERGAAVAAAAPVGGPRSIH